jgi:hypothetical protein
MRILQGSNGLAIYMQPRCYLCATQARQRTVAQGDRRRLLVPPV